MTTQFNLFHSTFESRIAIGVVYRPRRAPSSLPPRNPNRISKFKPMNGFNRVILNSVLINALLFSSFQTTWTASGAHFLKAIRSATIITMHDCQNRTFTHKLLNFGAFWYFQTCNCYVWTYSSFFFLFSFWTQFSWIKSSYNHSSLSKSLFQLHIWTLRSRELQLKTDSQFRWL